MLPSKSCSSSLIVLVVLSLTACSGGSVNVGVGIPAIPPVHIAESAHAFGVITDLGSVTVNGVDFGTGSANVALNGLPAALADLKLGQLVAIRGDVDLLGLQGQAERIQFEASIIGPVESVDSINARLIVMGQTIFWDDRTAFDPGIDPTTLSGLPIGSMAQISGLPNASGDIVATRIEPTPNGTHEQVIGRVESLDYGNLLFYINDTLIDYSNSTIVDIPGGEPADGMFLLVRGHLQNGLLVASELRPTTNLTQGAPLERVLIQGVVTRFNSAADFSILGTSFATDFNTNYVVGDAADLGLDVEVVVDGRFSLDGRTVVAEAIRFGRSPDQTTTRSYDLAGFTSVTITSVFDVTIEQGQEYIVEVTVDDSAIGNLAIEKIGNTLHVGLQGTIEDVKTIRARLSMPVIDHFISAGVVRTVVSGFDQQSIDVDLSGVSVLAASDSTFSDVTASASGVSILNLGNIRPVSSTNLSISGVSKATLNMAVGSSLSGSVTGASALLYYGTAVSLDVTTELSSTVMRLGDTKP